MQNEKLAADKERLLEEITVLRVQLKEAEIGIATTKVETLNDNIEQMLMAQSERILVGFEANAYEKTELFTKARDLEEAIIPALKGDLAQAQGKLSETQTELDRVNRASETTFKKLQAQLRHLKNNCHSRRKLY